MLATARWASALDRRDRVGLVFLDMSKAFNCVQHRTLLTDLMDIGRTGAVLKWFASYLSDRQQFFRTSTRTTAAPTVCRKAVCLACYCFRSTPKTYHPSCARQPSITFEVLSQHRDILHLHIEEAMAIQSLRPPLNRRDEHLGTGFLA